MRAVDGAVELLRRTGAKEILVAFSGGKDSIATLDLCVQHFERVEAFFKYLVPGLEVEERMLERVLRRFPNVKLHRVPHEDVSTYFRRNVFGCNPKRRPVPKVDAQALEAHLRQLTGIEWIAYGERAADSTVRNAKLKKIQGFWEKFRRVYPLCWFRRGDVYGYLRNRGLPAPRLIGGRRFTGAVAIYPTTLAWLEEHCPDDYAKIVRAYPGAPAAVFRWREGLAANRRGTFVDGSKTRPEIRERAAAE